jgi:hypothetical protein
MDDVINFLKAHEQPKPDIVLQRMSEDGICLLTGVNENLSYMPVDGNISNILPSNMACVTNEIAHGVEFSFNYQTSLWKELTIVFDSPPEFQEYNLVITEMVDREGDEGIKISEESFIPEIFPRIFEYLTAKHVKGLSKIIFNKQNCSMDWMQYQRSLMRSLAKIKKTSSIITPGSGGSSSHLGVVK